MTTQLPFETLPVCPFCGALYREERLEILPARGQQELRHATCTECKRAMVFAFERSPKGVACVGLFTDCTAEDWRHFEAMSKVTFDDVLEAEKWGVV